MSYHQGPINWPQVAAAGKRFAFVRATAGTLTADTTYWANSSGARAAGLDVGSYHFANPDLAFNDAGNEAAWFLRNAAIASGDLVPVLDLEVGNGLDPLIADGLGTDLAIAGLGGDRRATDHLHDAEVLVRTHGQHRLVREERLFGPVDRALDDGESARRSGRRLGRQRLDVLAVLEPGHRARDQRPRRSQPVQRFVPVGVAVRALTARPRPARPSGRPLLLAGVAAAFIVVGVILAGNVFSKLTTPGGEPPVLAGRQLWGSCAAGFYARRDSSIVLTSSAHCASEGMTALGPDGRTVRGVFGPAAVLDPCPHEGHTCRPSDINYLVVAPDQIPGATSTS